MTCVTSAYLYTRCPNPTTDQCVKYTGPEVSCLNLCTGMSISTVQNAMAQAICNIMAELDLTTISIPPCLVSAWGANEPTLINFITTLLTESCTLQSQIDSINTTLSTFDPLINVSFACCSTNPCVINGQVTVSQAIINLIACICDLTGVVNTLQTQVTNLQNEIGTFVTQANLATQINNLQSQITTIQNNLSTNVTTLTASIACINTNLGTSC